MLKKTHVLFLLAIILSLSLASCAKGDPQTQTQFDNNKTASKDITREPQSLDVDTDTPGTGFEDLLDTELPSAPLFNVFSVQPAVSLPGDRIAFSITSELNGTLYFPDAAGEGMQVEVTDGQAALTIPGDWKDGLYIASFKGEGGEIGFAELRVSSQPGVWLQSDKTYITGIADTLLHVEAMGLPDDMLAAVFVKSQPDAPEVPLVPDENGSLVPGVPVPPGEIEGGPWRLSSAYSGEVYVKAEKANPAPKPLEPGQVFDVPPADSYVSNAIHLQACSETGTITGSLGQAGFINVIWGNGSLHSQSAWTGDGAFSLQVGPGTVYVETITGVYGQSPEITQSLVEVGCKEEKRIALGETSVTPRSITAFSAAGLSSLLTSLSQLPAQLDSAAPQSTSQGGAEICRTGIIEARVKDGEVENQALSQAASLALKSALENAAPNAGIITSTDLQGLIDAMAQASLSGDEYSADVLAETLRNTINTDFLVTLNAARLGDSYAAAVAVLPLNDTDQSARAMGKGPVEELASSEFGVYSDLAEQFSHAAICGSVKPESKEVSPGESVELTYRAADLSGASVYSAEVTVSQPGCGKLDPQSGNLDNGEFHTQYSMNPDEYCPEDLDFSAKWDGPLGAVRTREKEAVARISPQLPKLSLRAGGATWGTDYNIVGAVTLYNDYDVNKAPGNLPALTTSDECGFVDGGTSLFNDWYFAHSEQPGKWADGVLSVFPFTDLTTRIQSPQDGPVDHFGINLQMSAVAIPVEDDGQIRGAWGSSGSANTLFPENVIPGTIYVVDINNPGGLSVIAMIQWSSNISTSGEAASYTAFAFYKVIHCGDDAGLGSMQTFYTNGEPLFQLFEDESSQPSGLKALPKFDDEHAQVLIYIQANTGAGSLKDSNDGIYMSSLSKMQIELDIYLSQEMGGG